MSKKQHSDTPGKTPPRQDWRQKPWASHEARKAESFVDKEGFDWEAELASYNAVPDAYDEEQRLMFMQQKRQIKGDIVAGSMTDVKIAPRSPHKPLQQFIDQTVDHWNEVAAASTQPVARFRNMPHLCVATRKNLRRIALNCDDFMGVAINLYIETNERTANRLLKNPEMARTVLSHELAHVLNGEANIENRTAISIARPGQVQEVLADRMGALLHGNPKEYAKQYEVFLERYINQSFSTQNTHIHTSPNRLLRMVHKWADMLEEAGATDKKTGQIIDYDKAIALYNESKKMAHALNVFGPAPVTRARS